jgi:hypothetical protein
MHANSRGSVTNTVDSSTAGLYSTSIAGSHNTTSSKDQEAAQRGGTAARTGGGWRGPFLSCLLRSLAAFVLAVFAPSLSVIIVCPAATDHPAVSVAACAAIPQTSLAYIELACATRI